MPIAYLFTPCKLGLELVLKQLGIEPVIKVLSPDKNGIMKKELNRLTKKILNSKPDESLLIFYDDEDAISLIEEFRFKYSIASPFLILSFTTQDKIEKRFTMSPRTNRPIMSFGKGMYHLQLPVKIDKLRDILREAVPVETTGMDYVKDEYEYSLTYQKDANFRHRCANLASAIRILQGAYYTGDIGKPDYLSAIASIKQRSNKIPGFKSYGEIISSYLDSFDDGKQCLSPGIYISKSLKPTKILLLDDEAITSGWDIVLETIFNKQDYSISSGTDREKCINEIESKEEIDFDILLLDLMMPDLPERSIHLIERITDRHPHIPIIVFSALTDLPYFRKCQEAGAFNYFAKELGSDDRDPEKYYQKLKEIISNAIKFREKLIRKSEKGYTHKIEGNPYFNCSYEEVNNQWIARFAYRVESVRGVPSESMAKEVDKLKDIQNRLLLWLCKQSADGRALSLRLQSFPDEKRFEMVFVGKTTGNTIEESQEKAHGFSKDLWNFLRMFSPIYRYVPVKRETEFLILIDDFKISNIFSIKRRRFEIKPNKSDCFKWFYPIFSNSNSNLLTTVKQVMAMKEPSVIGLTLAPCDFREIIFDRIKEINRLKNAPMMGSSSGEIGFLADSGKNMQDENLTLDFIMPEDVDKAFNNISNELRSSSEGGFLYHFFIASDNPIPVSILENIRYDYLGVGSAAEFVDSTLYKDITIPSIKCLDIPVPADNSSAALLQDFVNFSQASVLFKLPFPDADGVPGIEEDRTKIIELPRQYRQPLERDSFLLAEGFRDDRVEPIYINDVDLNKHLYICGKTGSGKSTLLLRLILSVIEKGEGLCLIDPHEDLAERVFERIPEERVNDVIYFNPRDERPIGINLLENDGSEEEQDMIVQEFVAMMFKLFSTKSMGPVFERGMRNTLILLLVNSLTLTNFSKIWHDTDFREKCLKKLNTTSPRDKDVDDFWRKEKEKWKGDLADVATYIISKFDRINNVKTMRSILGAKESTIDMSEIMNKGKILIVSLPRGLIGEINANILGMIISTKIRLSALSRASMHTADRRPFYLFIDEFQNFVSTGGLNYSEEGYDETFTSMVSEARKYKISLILANQYLEQLGKAMRSALFGNIGSLIAFKAGVEDSKYLQEHFANKISADNFRTIPIYHAYANLLMDGELLPPFTIKTIPIENLPADFKKRDRIIKQSRERYGIKQEER